MSPLLLAASLAAAALPFGPSQPFPSPAAPPALAWNAASDSLPAILVSPAWLAERLGDSTLVVLHVAHRRSAYDSAHVPGARWLRYEAVAREVNGVPVELPGVDELRAAFEAAGVGDGSRVVLYGDPMSAARAWMTLDYLGLGHRAAVLDGGLVAWRAEGHAVTTKAPRVARRTLTVRPQPARVVDASWVRARLDQPAVALIDARPENEYTGADGGHGGAHAAGHIPGAHHLYWERLMVSRSDPRFRSEAELRALFEEAGAAPGDTVVAYCFIGMRASVAYFVGRLLGYETRLYDGSWVDWSERKLPVVAGGAPGSLADARTP